MKDLRELTRQFAHDGRLEAIFLRPARGVAADPVDSVMAIATRGLEGDRSAATPSRIPKKRQVTLIQAEHLPLIATFIGLPSVDARTLRRNLVVSGLNLLAAKGLFADQAMVLRIGPDVVLRVTGPCEPCSRMEEALGPGAYNAMRGHGGITAMVEVGGLLSVGDAIRVDVASHADPVFATAQTGSAPASSV